MKIKKKSCDYQTVMAMPREKHQKPGRPWSLFALVIRLLGLGELWRTRFSYTCEGLDKIKKEPALILMNHSCFLDLKIVNAIFFGKRKYHIVCTSDGFVGKKLLMRLIGCIPTTKFVADTQLIRDMQFVLKEKKRSVLMYPEASYSFDGTKTPLPQKMGALLKRLDVPVISIITEGAFLHDPLYNGLRQRRVKVSAKAKCLLTREEIAEKSTEELDGILNGIFDFDGFKYQKQNGIEVRDETRALGLERILYKCAHCGKEGSMQSSGESIECLACGKKYHLDFLGNLKAEEGETEFSHIPDWYAFQRECVKKELERGEYRLDCDVDIAVLVNYKSIYTIGQGHLLHTNEGFVLTGCAGQLNYSQKPLSSYSLYADYFWYEIGDVICIGTKDCLYYCFPKDSAVSVAKARLATEELYKLLKQNTISKKEVKNAEE